MYSNQLSGSVVIRVTVSDLGQLFLIHSSIIADSVHPLRTCELNLLVSVPDIVVF